MQKYKKTQNLSFPYDRTFKNAKVVWTFETECYEDIKRAFKMPKMDQYRVLFLSYKSKFISKMFNNKRTFVGQCPLITQLN